MRKIALPSIAILGAMFVLLLHAAPAQAATSTKTWVANGVGDDANPCSRAAPCLTFQAAHDATTAGGEINCVDAADYGLVTISKSISIVCDNTQAGILVGSGSIAVNIAGGVNDVVTLKGLDLDGSGIAIAGINIITAGVVHVHKVQIRGFFSGIAVQTNNYTELYVADSYITGNGSGGSGGGIMSSQGGSGSANISINRVRLENNANGIDINTLASTGLAANALVVDSVISGSAGDGIRAVSAAGRPAVSILVDRSVVSGNFGSGIKANGVAASGAGSALVRIGDSTIALNATGVSTTGLGVVQSFKNNRISGNLTDGTPLPAFPGPGGTPLQ